MVQQKERIEELDDAPIIDETSDEQVAIEKQVMEGKSADAPKPEPVELKAEPKAEPVAAAPAPVSPPITQTPTPQPEVPKARIYTEEEVRRMQSSWDRQIAEARKAAQEHQARLQQYDTEAQVEAHLRAQERQLEASLGAEEAKRLVRTPENAAQVKKNLQNEQQVRALQERERALEQEQELQAKVITARLLAQEHGVSADRMKLLLAVNDPDQMAELARFLGQPAPKPSPAAQVPPETHKTRLESPDASGGQIENADRRLSRLNMTPASNWTDADWEFMRTGR